MNKKVKILLISIFGVLAIIALGYGIYYFIQKNQNNINTDEKIANSNDIISHQQLIDEQIKEILDNTSFNFDNPRILENPYIISPLSALILFNTENEISYDVYLNGELVTKTEYSKKHSVPVYGLISGFDNVIKLEGSDGKSKELNIKTNEYNYKVDVELSQSKNNVYFLSSPDEPGYFAINSDGKVIWYLNGLSGQDLEFLSNGHILVNNNVDGSINSYTGFYEIDYLGKIYKSYSLENNYHHEVNELKDGNLLVAGEKNDSKILESYISTIDKESGKEIKSLDIYDVIANVDSEFAESLISQDIINNSIYYNEDKDELVLSLRGLNTVMCVNYSSKEIKWMLADKKDWSDKFDKYILKSTDNSRLPKGQHTAFINESGQLGLLNNDYDPKDTKKVFVKEYVNNYSSATYYEIDNSNMTYKTVWNYIDKDKVFNYALSSFNISNDNHKIINFGWSFPSSSYQNNALSIFDEMQESYTRLVELDENNNIVFRSKIYGNIYRAFKNKLYNKTTINYFPEDVQILNAVPYSSLEEVSTISIKNKIDNANDKICDLILEDNVISINMFFDTMEDVKLLFKSDLISYMYSYKPKDRSVNSRINLDIKGKYDIYLIIDDVYYKTDAILDTNGKTITITNN